MSTPTSNDKCKKRIIHLSAERNQPQTDNPCSNQIVARVKDFVLSYYLPLLSVSSVVIGYLYPQPGRYLANKSCASLSITAFFIASGLALEQGDALRAFDFHGALSVGLILILLVTPLLAPLVMKLTLNPEALSLGLAVFLLAPTTLASGVAQIQVAEANVSMAMLLALMSNFLAVFTMPISLFLVIGFTDERAVPLVLFKNLIQTFLAPTLFALFAKSWIKGVEKWIKIRKKRISFVGRLFLTSITWMEVSRASTSVVSVDPISVTIVVLLGVSIHLFFLLANHLVTHSLPLGGSEPRQALAIRRAVVLLSSQKAMVVALAVLNELTPFLGTEVVGVACIPCILVNFSQTIIGSILASFWAKSQGEDGGLETILIIKQ